MSRGRQIQLASYIGQTLKHKHVSGDQKVPGMVSLWPSDTGWLLGSDTMLHVSSNTGIWKKICCKLAKRYIRAAVICNECISFNDCICLCVLIVTLNLYCTVDVVVWLNLIKFYLCTVDVKCPPRGKGGGRQQHLQPLCAALQVLRWN